MQIIISSDSENSEVIDIHDVKELEGIDGFRKILHDLDRKINSKIFFCQLSIVEAGKVTKTLNVGKILQAEMLKLIQEM